jgi:hypothetical protein
MEKILVNCGQLVFQHPVELLIDLRIGFHGEAPVIFRLGWNEDSILKRHSPGHQHIHKLLIFLGINTHSPGDGQTHRNTIANHSQLHL